MSIKPTLVFETSIQKQQTPENKALKETAPQSCASHWAQLLQDHPELADLLAAWPKLPDAIKAAIQAMIDALK